MTDSLTDIWGMKKRGKRDYGRYKHKIKKAIKDNLKELITDYNIISSDGKKKIKIPVKSLDQYRFKHAGDPNQEGVGQGNDGKPGDAIAQDQTGQKGKDGKAGEQAGEDVYEEEVELKDILDMMMEDLGLPWVEEKQSKVEVESEDIVFTDLATVGPLSNVDKRKTVIENMKRNAKRNGKVQIKNIHNDDLRYKVWEQQVQYHSNAAVYCLLDRSGSMTEERKYLSKAFYFYLVHFCKTRYKHVELVFIAHDTQAKIVPEENFFTISNSGGTKCSSAYELALKNIKENHPKDHYNTYLFHFSDGDNWSEDNEKCIGLVRELLNECTAVGYGEINVGGFYGISSVFNWSTLSEVLEKEIDHPRFMTAKIEQKEDIYNALKKFLHASVTKQ